MMPSAPKAARRPTSIRLSPQVYAWLRNYAHEQNLSQSDIVDDILREYATEQLQSRKVTNA